MEHSFRIKYFFLLASLMLSMGCEKDIELDLNTSAPQLVINGNITNTAGPYTVQISKSQSVYDTNQYLPISDAIVVVSDNTGVKDTLIQTTLGKYSTQKIIGAIGRTYYLTVVHQAKTYTATSKMPTAISLDSLIQAQTNFGGTIQKLFVPVFQDPIELGNHSRMVTKINGKQDRATNVFNDVVNNGQRNTWPMFTKTELKTGDSVTVELQCIDESVYSYFFAIYNMENGVIPSNPPSNISGGCLGYFSAHAVSRRSTKVK